MSDPTVGVIDHRDGVPHVYECDGCLSRWALPVDMSIDAIETREYRLGLISAHQCDPAVDPTRVRSIRARAAEIVPRMGVELIRTDVPADSVDPTKFVALFHAESAAGEGLALEFDFDVPSFTAAETSGTLCATVEEQAAAGLVSAALTMAQRATESPERRARQLARQALVAWDIPIEPTAFTPEHARLAVGMLDEARADIARNTPDDLPDWLESPPPMVSDADAVLWLAEVERTATGIF